MYREVQAFIQRIVQQLSEQNVYVPLPHSTLIEEVYHARALEFTLNYGNENQNRPFSFRIDYRRSRGAYIVNREFQNLIRQAYTDFNFRADQVILHEVYRNIYYRTLNDGQFQEIENRRRHLNDILDQFYRNQQSQLDRLFTLRDLESEQEHYNQSREDIHGVIRHLNFNHQLHLNHPQPYPQPAPNRELVLERLERAKQVLESYLFGELPGNYYISQIQKLRDVNHAYERACHFYRLRSNNQICDRAVREEVTTSTPIEYNLRQEYARRRVRDYEREIYNTLRDQYIGDWDFAADPGQEQRKKAEERGEKLLLENLTQEQKKSYKKNQYFIVKGGDTGKLYKIKKGHHSNVYELDKNGNELVGWCFIPAGSLCSGDVMLSQKIGLELHEKEALKVANPFSDNRGNNTREGIIRRYGGLSHMFNTWMT